MPYRPCNEPVQPLIFDTSALEPASRSGLWISPCGLVILLQSTHIEEIIAAPDRFGTASEEIRAAYRHFGEPMPVEGYARWHIIRAVVFGGWIRIRQQLNYWSVTVDQLKARKPILQCFFQRLHADDRLGHCAELRIFEVEREQMTILSAHELLPESASPLPALLSGTIDQALPRQQLLFSAGQLPGAETH